MTGRWEKELAEIEKGRTPHEAFLRDIEGYTRKITTELLACDKIFGHKASGCACPKCGTGTMQFYGKVVRCDNPDCALPVFRQIAGRTLTDAEMTGLLAKGKTDILSGFKSKQGKPFSAAVAFDADFNTKFIFPEAKVILFLYMDLVAALGGIPGAFFLLLYPYQYPIFSPLNP